MLIFPYNIHTYWWLIIILTTVVYNVHIYNMLCHAKNLSVNFNSFARLSKLFNVYRQTWRKSNSFFTSYLFFMRLLCPSSRLLCPSNYSIYFPTSSAHPLSFKRLSVHVIRPFFSERITLSTLSTYYITYYIAIQLGLVLSI